MLRRVLNINVPVLFLERRFPFTGARISLAYSLTNEDGLQINTSIGWRMSSWRNWWRQQPPSYTNDREHPSPPPSSYTTLLPPSHKSFISQLMDNLVMKMYRTKELSNIEKLFKDFVGGSREGLRKPNPILKQICSRLLCIVLNGFRLWFIFYVYVINGSCVFY